LGKPVAGHQMPFFDADAQQAPSLPELPATDKPLPEIPAPLPELPATDKPLTKTAEWDGGDGDATAGGGDAAEGPLELSAWTDECAIMYYIKICALCACCCALHILTIGGYSPRFTRRCRDKPVSVTYDGGGDKVDGANYEEEDDGHNADEDEDEDEDDEDDEDDDDDAPAETDASGADAAAAPPPAAAPNIFQLAAENAQVQEAIVNMEEKMLKMKQAATMQVPLADAGTNPALAGGRGAAAADGLPPLQPTLPPKPPPLKPRKPKGIKGYKKGLKKGIKGIKQKK
jgi:hypothetical protein